MVLFSEDTLNLKIMRYIEDGDQEVEDDVYRTYIRICTPTYTLKKEKNYLVGKVSEDLKYQPA